MRWPPVGHLILPSGTWFSLDRPELEQLRLLIAEARELGGDAGDGQVRLRTEHAGLWEELVSLGVVAEQSAAWTRAASALLGLDELPQPPVPKGLTATCALTRISASGGCAAPPGWAASSPTTWAWARPSRRWRWRALKEAGELDRPLLVVAPTSVLSTWAEQAARFAPGLVVRLVTQTSKKRNEPLAHRPRAPTSWSPRTRWCGSTRTSTSTNRGRWCCSTRRSS
ncbi:MAG: hypothetical protein R2742_15785 [Micropruina glycogenica]